MKKILMFMMLLVVGVVVIACDSNPLKGVDPVSVVTEALGNSEKVKRVKTTVSFSTTEVNVSGGYSNSVSLVESLEFITNGAETLDEIAAKIIITLSEETVYTYSQLTIFGTAEDVTVSNETETAITITIYEKKVYVEYDSTESNNDPKVNAVQRQGKYVADISEIFDSSSELADPDMLLSLTEGIIASFELDQEQVEMILAIAENVTLESFLKSLGTPTVKNGKNSSTFTYAITKDTVVNVITALISPSGETSDPTESIIRAAVEEMTASLELNKSSCVLSIDFEKLIQKATVNIEAQYAGLSIDFSAAVDAGYVNGTIAIPVDASIFVEVSLDEITSVFGQK